MVQGNEKISRGEGGSCLLLSAPTFRWKNFQRGGQPAPYFPRLCRPPCLWWLCPQIPISIILHCKFFTTCTPQSTDSFGINQKT